MKKILLIKIFCVVFGIVFFFAIIIGLITMITGVSIGYNLEKQAKEAKEVNTVVNNQIYASRYRSILDKYLLSNGYVTLERLVFYLQTKYNVLDITNLSQKEWEQAYLENSNNNYKQMIPIKTICLNLKNDSSLTSSTIKSGFNKEGIYIEKLNLCVVDGIDITESDEYLEGYNFLLYEFPLKDSFQTTSIVFEYIDIDLDLTEEEKKKTNITIVEDVYEYIKKSENDKYLKITVCDESKAIFNSIIRKLKQVKNIEVLDVSHMSRKTINQGTEEIDIKYYYTEISLEDVDKWNAIEFLLEETDIKKEEVIAIGDNINDKKMIQNI